MHDTVDSGVLDGDSSVVDRRDRDRIDPVSWAGGVEGTVRAVVACHPPCQRTSTAKTNQVCLPAAIVTILPVAAIRLEITELELSVQPSAPPSDIVKIS